jgi:hypothetical protein
MPKPFVPNVITELEPVNATEHPPRKLQAAVELEQHGSKPTPTPFFMDVITNVITELEPLRRTKAPCAKPPSTRPRGRTRAYRGGNPPHPPANSQITDSVTP